MRPAPGGRLRARYAAITPGYHLNKRHWNTVELDDSVPDEELLDLIDHSYDLVVSSLTKAQRDSLPPTLTRRIRDAPDPGARTPGCE